ncbi:hypothetical protein AU467_27420 [Mesorhizobium loti]|uniref:Uncharacterized protein n=1 Tax=Rhizobium loti TaxID=381 RepID=A0A117N2S8_RHILI|nr:hypothetical protein AU467_27420 [Mesorhizobium loti]
MKADAPLAPTTLTRGEALSILSAGIAGPCCGEAHEMLAWLYLLPPSDAVSSETGAEPPVESPRPRLRLRGLFRWLGYRRPSQSGLS